MRIAKSGEVRKQELLDAALELFYEKGYEKTSVNDIIEKVGVTKGAFYYYFTAKEDVLDALALQQAENLITISQKIASEERLNALEKVNKLIVESQGYRVANIEHRLKIFKVFNRDENLKFSHRILERVVQLSRPIIQSIIEQGVKEGIFDVLFPDEAAELYVRLVSIFNNELGKVWLEIEGKPNAKEILHRKILFYENMLERLLGVEKGSLVLATTLSDLLSIG